MFIIGTGSDEPLGSILGADVPVKGGLRSRSAGAQKRHRDAKQGVRAKAALRGCSVQANELGIKRSLIEGRGRATLSRSRHSHWRQPCDTLTTVPRLVAVAQFKRLTFARGRP